MVPGCPYSVSGQLPGVVGDEAREGAGESESVGQGSEGQGASEAVAVAVGDGKGEGQAAAGVEDVAGRWARIAEAEFARDGDARGWESEEEGERLTAQERYARDHPGVPVVENLEDMWMLTKYQVRGADEQVWDCGVLVTAARLMTSACLSRHRMR